ncbi:MAG TPA: BrnT family toxin [Bryobacteraceae bacterium]|nr:BrnT family toxin [Bryobacteraceae bacterium]HUO30943.1 BrnT family toxin [Bryobacteraceae bacterium]
MQGLAFEWDWKKEAANRRKHTVGFADASTVFGDPLSITIPDPDHAAGEERFLIIGMSSEHKLLVVVHTIRGARIRIISARLATQHERRNYEETPL